MTSADMVITNGYVLTMDEERAVYPDGAVAIAGTSVIDVGASSDVRARVSAGRVIDAKGGLVHPGFVDCHSHVTYHLLRGAISQTASYGDVLPDYIAYLNAVDDEDEHASALLAYLEMISNGTTCFVEAGTAHSTAAIAAAAEQIGIRGFVGDPFVADVGVPKALALDRAPATSKRAADILGTELRRNQAPDSLVRGHVALQGMATASDELELAAKELADSSESILNQHQSYHDGDVAEDDSRHGRHAMVHLGEIGVLGKNCLFAHLNVVREDEIAPIVSSGMSIAWCPAASMLWAVGGTIRGRHSDLYEQGVNVALGSDSSNWANRFDVGMQGYLAVLTAREKTGDRSTLLATDVLEMAIANGAKAAGLTASIGSLEPGKRADLVIRALDLTEAYPLNDPLSQVVFSTGSKSVRTVVINGRVVLEERMPTQVDTASVLRGAQAAAARVFDRMGYRIADRVRSPVATTERK